MKKAEAYAIALLFSVLNIAAWGAQVSDSGMGKASQEIIEKAKKNELQYLTVILDGKDVTKAINEKRRTMCPSDDAINLLQEKRKAIDALKENVFPHDRMGDIEVVGSAADLPFFIIKVPDWKSLKLLLSHPEVKEITQRSMEEENSFGESAKGKELRENMDTLSDLIKKEIGRPEAEDVSECDVIGFGSRGCGGVEEYLAYSRRVSDESFLRALTERFNALDKEYKTRTAAISICSIEMKPDVVLVDGVCRTQRRQFRSP